MRRAALEYALTATGTFGALLALLGVDVDREAASIHAEESMRFFYAFALLLACSYSARTQGVTPRPSTPWWKGAVLYEIYPRSFQDSNSDGIGDLKGITNRLAYLERLGVDAIWLTPAYPSPQVDFGYDISDYEAIDPQYGTMADFDQLIAEASERRIHIVMDMVLNHTSEEHPWFSASRSSRSSDKRDWYVWRDPKGYTADGKPIPPNNWQSVFGHSAWEWDARTQQFYYHRFYAQQPDLNWRNPAVEQAMFGVLRFWLNKGVSGFRLDAVPALYEDPQMRDEPLAHPGDPSPEPELNHIYTSDEPELHPLMERLRKLVASYPGDRVLVGETYVPKVEKLLPWYGGAAKDELQLPMDMMLGFGDGDDTGTKHLNAAHFREALSDAETKLNGAEPLFVFANHDTSRDWDRFGDGVHNAAIARIIATVLLTSRDTALLYYGEEIGMHTQTPNRIEDVRDPIGRERWPKDKGRDGERTPMQWMPGPQAGFSSAPHTWLPVEEDYRTVNVRSEEQDPGSLLRWYMQLMQLRKENAAFAPDATMEVLPNTVPDVLAYIRTGADSKRVLVVINMSADQQAFDLDSFVRKADSFTTFALSGGSSTGVLGVPAAGAPQNLRFPNKHGETVELSPFSVWIVAADTGKAHTVGMQAGSSR